MYEDKPKPLRLVLTDLDEKKEKALQAERIAKILEDVTNMINNADNGLSAYPELYDSWRGYHGRLQINGVENMRTQIPVIIVEFAKAGYRVKKFTDSPQSSLRTYYLCLREDEKIEDIHINAYLAVDSAQCHYVQVGTRTKEEPIYELQCHDPDSPKSEPGDPVESDMSSGEQREPEGVSPEGEECGDSADSPNLCERLQPDCSPEGAAPTVDTEGPMECGEV